MDNPWVWMTAIIAASICFHRLMETMENLASREDMQEPVMCRVKRGDIEVEAETAEECEDLLRLLDSRAEQRQPHFEG